MVAEKPSIRRRCAHRGTSLSVANRASVSTPVISDRARPDVATREIDERARGDERMRVLTLDLQIADGGPAQPVSAESRTFG
jgi:hypothetical protein